MSRIRALPPTVVAKIAAGEVIERPASAVKELIENSIDAGATRIEIDLDAGGTEAIRVVDDGHGIAAEDLPLAFASHATSKLRDADDLFRIGTMGFRGEALSSIGGVAQMRLQSRARDAETGAELTCHGGELSDIRPWGGAVGTRIEVKHLFYNTPVRRKFLKTVATELRTISEAVTRLALARPGLHLVLRHNQRTVFEVPASATLPDRIELFFGGEVRDSLLDLDAEAGPYRVTGFVCDPVCDRGNAQSQYLFVNGRWFRDRSLQHALQEAYRGLLMTGRYAVGFLFLTVPPDSVDVNVHPTKSEVRFRDNSALYSLIRGAVKQRLLKANLVPRLTAPAGEPAPMPEVSPRRTLAETTTAPWDRSEPDPTLPFRFPMPDSATPRLPFTPLPSGPSPAPPSPSTAAPVSSDSADAPPPPELASLQIAPGAAMQIHDSYLVLEAADGMEVIDQHALHERILFEQLRQRVRDGQLEIQRLLIPEPIDLPPVQAAAVLEARDELASLGLEVSDFGGNTILLSSFPTLLARRTPSEILQVVVDELASKDRPPAKEQLLHLLMATMACKAAVKAGDKLSPEEIRHLLELRQLAEDSHHCPHGRPTSLIFRRSELDRQFRRT